MIHAKEYRLLLYDNASGMEAKISDALCALATGGGLGVRRLYTDEELQVFTYSRPFIINGISGYARRPDLLERAIPLRLPAMPQHKRRTEGEILTEFERIRPHVLGALYDAVRGALLNHPLTPSPTTLRMADAARWISAAETAAGFSPGTMVAAISSAQDALVVERMGENALVIAIEKVVRNAGGVFDGHVGELFEAVTLESGRDRSLPKTSQQLSTQLVRFRSSMAKAGLEATLLPRDKGGRRVRITLRDDGSVLHLPPPF